MIKNTAPIQMQSVVNFMGALGFVPDRQRNNGSFRNEGQRGKVANRHVSFETAVKLHNTPIEAWQMVDGFGVFPDLQLSMAFNPLAVVMAHAGKLVQHTKIRFDKNGGMILSEGANLVRPVNGIIQTIIEAEIPA